MSVTGIEQAEKKQNKAATLVVTAAIVLLSALLILGFWYIRRQPAPNANVAQARLDNAVRRGTPEWDKNIKNLVLEVTADDKFESLKAMGGIWMKIQPTLRNFTGKSVTGLEMRVYVHDLQGRIVKEKTQIVIPGNINGVAYEELENNKTVKIPLTLDGFKQTDERADIKMEITGFRLQ
jgi:hypothetical protein